MPLVLSDDAATATPQPALALPGHHVLWPLCLSTASMSCPSGGGGPQGAGEDLTLWGRAGAPAGQSAAPSREPPVSKDRAGPSLQDKDDGGVRRSPTPKSPDDLGLQRI